MKKLRPEVEEDLKGCGGLMDAMDDVFCSYFNVTLDELEYIAEHASDDEMSTFVNGLGSIKEKPTFTEKRNSLMVRNKFLEIKNKD
jgi:hypothetical protein